MIRKLIILLLSAVALTAFPTLAANVVSVGGGSGSPGDEVEISVSLNTDAADVAAAEIRIPMPAGMMSVEGSCVKTGDRLAAHSVSASLNGSEYVIVIFNTSLTPIPAGSGEILRFRVVIGDNPGSFSTAPRVKLSDASGNGLEASSNGGILSVTAPSLTLSRTSIDFGRVAIRSSYSQSVTATNTGTAELRVTGMEYSAPELQAKFGKDVLAPGESTTMEVTYSPVASAERAVGRVTPVSNSVGAAPFVVVSAQPYSLNQLNLADVSGRSGETVTMHVSLDNMEPVVGLEFMLPLPEGVEYVEGSATPAARAAGMSATANVDADNTLRVVLFSLSNTPLSGESGDVVSFDLLLNCSGSTYSLWAQNVKLANAAGENVNSATWMDWNAGRASLSVEAPSLNIFTRLALGNIPMGEDPETTFNIYNNGTAPLVIEKIVADGGFAFPDAEFPIQVQPWTSVDVPVKLVDPVFGNFTSRWLVYSNDPARRMEAVTLTGNCYSPNELKFSGITDGNKYTLSASLENAADITALQLDIVSPEDMTLDTESLRLSERAAGHSATIAEVSRGRYRVIIFSLTNKPIEGNSGELFTLEFSGTDFPGKQLRMENIKLSSVDGVNYTTPTTDFQLSTIPIEVESVVLSKTELNIRIGSTAYLQATVLPENATDKTVVWASSNPDIASVDAYGNITTSGIGTAEITATAGDVSATCHVTVEGIPVENIWLSINYLELRLGDTFQFQVTVWPDDASDKTIVWSSSDESVATVDANGLVTAAGVGSAIITATCGEVSATCEIVARPIEVESIELSHTTVTLHVGDTFQLSATVYPENATDKTVTWSSDLSFIATINEDGLITAHAIGSCYVRANNGNVWGYCQVIVEPIEAESIVLSDTEVTMRVNEMKQITATVLPEETTDKSVRFESSNPEVVAVNQDGSFVSRSVGTATIIVTCGNVSASCKVTVVPTTAERIELSDTSLTLRVGEGWPLSATVYPYDAADKTIVWSSSDEEVASVAVWGSVYALKVGHATITATCGDVSATCEVTVEPTPVERIELSDTSLTLRVGGSWALWVEVYPSDATDKTVVWSSSDEEVASVSSDGSVVALKVGNATVTATCGDVSATCEVTVEPTPVERIELSDTSLTLRVGGSWALWVEVYPSDATDKTVVWSSSDEEVASVSSDGSVVALKVGNATVTATCGDVSATCEVTVEPTLAESLTLDITEKEALPGESFQLTATVGPDDVTDPGLVWESDNPAVADVDRSGYVTVYGSGVCVVSVSTTDGSNLRAECLVSGLSGIEGLWINSETRIDVYDLHGVRVLRDAGLDDFRRLSPGYYILNGRKVRKE